MCTIKSLWNHSCLLKYSHCSRGKKSPFGRKPNLRVCTLFLYWLKPRLWLVDLNYNFKCDWLVLTTTLNVTSAVDIHFWIHFSCDLIGPGQTKTKQGWPRETGTNQIATRNFLRSGHIEVQSINVKSVCRQHSLIYLTYNNSTDISSLFSDSKNGLADSFQHIFCVWIEGPTIRRVAGIYAPPPDSLFIENFWVEEGFVDKRGSPFTILF